ncbi:MULTISPECIES: polyphosphate kinase 1 [Thiomicrorhabdus]|uniref:Polyphosphate kinase n=1 Tax=Thiomicrorhabdus heinhorstiae TaxID=2748010 RepID=A0ABS0BUY4_9GAMM|nr:MULTISPECIES: polyphosphate kinase 1 [Thiomicrorhabdus]MBF6057633.1 polyphosphate kinase 1 [Thiomicrorhabdus heinhorstiae]
MTAASTDVSQALENDEAQLPLYINREQSLLEFNRRVLAQAKRTDIPLLERVKYLCISCSNMDEFFEVRLAGLYELTHVPGALTQPDDMEPAKAIETLSELAHEIVDDQYHTLNHVLVPELEKENIRFLRRNHWNDQHKEWIRNYFIESLQPVLSAVGLDPSHPFPKVLNKSLNFIVSLEGKDAFGRSNGLAIVPVPRSLPRIIKLPPEATDGENDFVFLSSMLHANVSLLFPGMTVTGCYQFRVTRNTNLFIDEEEVEDIMSALRGELSGRQYGGAIRLEVADNCPPHMVEYLLDRFNLDEKALYQVHGPVNLHRLNAVPDMANRPDLQFPPHQPKPMSTKSAPKKAFRLFTRHKQPETMFERIANKDILLHHPYDAFTPVVDFLKQASTDPDVLAIRMTLYRTGDRSPIIDALDKAAQNGKEVTAVVELRARFDEDNNILQATRLQDAGVHVVYGVVGYKTHAKMILVVRREQGKIRYYTHMGTGNYHQITTRFYSDFGLLTANQAIGRDASKVFQQLTSLGETKGLEVLLQSPFTLHSGMIERIQREAEHARQGKPARIIAKMNGLEEKEIIDALYEASQAGVQIDLIVRGICSLRPGVPGLSENIRVTSIIGRFLEHHRVYYFENDGKQPELYCASADWMKRNLLSRVETCFPVLDPACFQQVYTEGLAIYLQDNTGAWLLQPNGSYLHKETGDQEPFNAQQSLIEKYQS